MHQACTQSAWRGAEALAPGVAATDAVSVTQETPVAKGLMQSPLPALIFNAELQITWANEAAGKVSRVRPAAQWAGRRLGQVLSGMDADLIEQSLQGVLATGRAGIRARGEQSRRRRPRWGAVLELHPVPRRWPAGRRLGLGGLRDGGDH